MSFFGSFSKLLPWSSIIYGSNRQTISTLFFPVQSFDWSENTIYPSNAKFTTKWIFKQIFNFSIGTSIFVNSSDCIRSNWSVWRWIFNDTKSTNVFENRNLIVDILNLKIKLKIKIVWFFPSLSSNWHNFMFAFNWRTVILTIHLDTCWLCVSGVSATVTSKE